MFPTALLWLLPSTASASKSKDSVCCLLVCLQPLDHDGVPMRPVGGVEDRTSREAEMCSHLERFWMLSCSNAKFSQANKKTSFKVTLEDSLIFSPFISPCLFTPATRLGNTTNGQLILSGAACLVQMVMTP